MNIFADLPNRQAAEYGDREQLRYRDRVTAAWTSMSWNALRHAVERVAVALYDLNLEEQGRLCLFTQNCPEIFIAHFAAFYNRAVPVPIYATSSRDEAAYIINDSGA
ncbi:MAG: AMP-binding protein, partial [Muribaculaceae bacterium]|nr:AMP-binding protein [Muribaculaceae bacterium]